MEKEKKTGQNNTDNIRKLQLLDQKIESLVKFNITCNETINDLSKSLNNLTSKLDLLIENVTKNNEAINLLSIENDKTNKELTEQLKIIYGHAETAATYAQDAYYAANNSECNCNCRN